MMRHRVMAGAICLACAAGLAAAGGSAPGAGVKSEGAADAGAGSSAKDVSRKIMDQHAESLVWVKYAGNMEKFTGGGRGKAETALGIVLTPEGDIVCAQSVMSRALGRVLESQGKSDEVPKPSDVKVILPDGRKLDADLVAEDRDYGLMFLRIRKDALDKDKLVLKPLPHTSGVKVGVGDDLLYLGRMPEKFGSVPSVQSGTVSAETAKPVKAYAATGLGVGALMPVFSLQGALVGFASSYEASFAKAQGSVEMTPLIIPVDNLTPIFKQIKEAKVAAQEEPAPRHKVKGDPEEDEDE